MQKVPFGAIFGVFLGHFRANSDPIISANIYVSNGLPENKQGTPRGGWGTLSVPCNCESKANRSRFNRLPPKEAPHAAVDLATISFAARRAVTSSPLGLNSIATMRL